MSSDSWPSYLALYESGELHRRAEQARESLRACRVCPRCCLVNRLEDERKICRTGRYARVASYFAHLGEEDCLRGWNGSGTIFFVGCNLRCVFCQNADISQPRPSDLRKDAATPAELAGMMLELQRRGCHNINLVTPEHVVPQILEALPIAVEKGLKLPIVYNTSGYDSPESLQFLDGVVDIYMPDFKFYSSALAAKYLKAKDYPEVVRGVLREMHRQVGDLTVDIRGLARRGLLVRHLVMPGCLDDSKLIFQFLAREISRDTYVNVMNQYFPAHKTAGERYPELQRRLHFREYRQALRLARAAGLHRFD